MTQFPTATLILFSCFFMHCTNTTEEISAYQEPKILAVDTSVMFDYYTYDELQIVNYYFDPNILHRDSVDAYADSAVTLHYRNGRLIHRAEFK